MTMKNINLSSRYKRSKTALIVSAGQKWVQLERQYLHSYWIPDAKILMAGGQGDDLSACKRIFIYYLFIEQVIKCLKTAELLSCSS